MGNTHPGHFDCPYCGKRHHAGFEQYCSNPQIIFCDYENFEDNMPGCGGSFAVTGKVKVDVDVRVHKIEGMAGDPNIEEVA